MNGACRGADPELFFADDDPSIAEAKTICGGCPVRVDCLNHAIGTNQSHGIWGGLTRQERAAELIKRRDIAGRTPATVAERRALVTYLSENLRPKEIAALIGATVDVVKRDRQEVGAGPVKRGLTATGAEIYRLADTGLPRRVIAEQVQVSKRTVERWMTKRREEQRRTGPGRPPSVKVAARRTEVARLAEQGLSNTVIAARLGVHRNVVTEDLRQLRGHYDPAEAEARAAAEAARVRERDERIDAMLRAGVSVTRISEVLHVNARTVRRRRDLLAVGVAA